jgi:hypothetical protein
LCLGCSVTQLQQSTAEALASLQDQLGGVADSVPTTDRMDSILRMLYDVERYISENRRHRDEVRGHHACVVELGCWGGVSGACVRVAGRGKGVVARCGWVVGEGIMFWCT